MLKDPTPQYRGRFAPTPSGPLHFGSLFVALASWLDARHHQGEWWLRIDDIDPPRQQAGAADIICRQLEAAGLEWDKKILQSQRSSHYLAAIEQLLDEGHAFHCRLSRKQLAAIPQGHPGKSAAVAATRNSAVRLAVDDQELQLNDLYQPSYLINLQTIGGAFVIHRRDRYFAYHLACAVDDAQLGMTHIIRGADLLATTAQQQLVMQRLGYPTPLYGHLPLIMDGKDKLAKASGAASISDMPAPLLLCKALAALGMSPPASLTKAPVTAILDWGVAHWPQAELPQTPLDINQL